MEVDSGAVEAGVDSVGEAEVADSGEEEEVGEDSGEAEAGVGVDSIKSFRINFVYCTYYYVMTVCRMNANMQKVTTVYILKHN